MPRKLADRPKSSRGVFGRRLRSRTLMYFRTEEMAMNNLTYGGTWFDLPLGAQSYYRGMCRDPFGACKLVEKVGSLFRVITEWSRPDGTILRAVDFWDANCGPIFGENVIKLSCPKCGGSGGGLDPATACDLCA